MATHVAKTAKDWKQAIVSDAGNEFVARGYVAASEFTLAQNDIIQMVKVPAGARITNVRLYTGALGTSATVDVGDGTTEDRFIAAANHAAAAMTSMKAMPTYQYADEDTIDVKIEGANPADDQIIELLVWYVMPSQTLVT